MVKMRKRIAAIAAAAVMGVSMVSGTCISASAADPGIVHADNGYGTLTNISGTTRYGNVNLQVIKRDTGSIVKRAGNEKTLSNYSTVTASVSGYTSVTYRFKATGTLYKGTNVQSGKYWSDKDEY